MFPGISLTYDEMESLASGLDQVIAALGGENVAVEVDTGDDALSGAVGDFTVHWAGKRDKLTTQLSDLQTYIATIIQAMKQADHDLTPTPTPTPPSPPPQPPPNLDGWPVLPDKDSSPDSPYPWMR